MYNSVICLFVTISNITTGAVRISSVWKKTHMHTLIICNAPQRFIVQPYFLSFIISTYLKMKANSPLESAYGGWCDLNDVWTHLLPLRMWMYETWTCDCEWKGGMHVSSADDTKQTTQVTAIHVGGWRQDSFFTISYIFKG